MHAMIKSAVSIPAQTEAGDQPDVCLLLNQICDSIIFIIIIVFSCSGLYGLYGDTSQFRTLTFPMDLDHVTM